MTTESPGGRVSGDTLEVCYHIGTHMSLSSKLHWGTLELGDDSLVIHGEPEVSIPYRDITFPTESHRLHFLCRMLRVIHRHGHLFISVPLLRCLGKPVISHYPKLVELQTQIDEAFRTAWKSAPSPEGSRS